MNKKRDLYKRVYKSLCTIQDDIVSYNDFTKLHAKDIDMLATGKDKKIIGYFVRESDEEMIDAFDNVGKLQMKINVLKGVLEKNNKLQKDLYEQIKDEKVAKEEYRKRFNDLEKEHEKWREKIISLLIELDREEEVEKYIRKEEPEEKNEEELEDDDINDILDKFDVGYKREDD